MMDLASLTRMSSCWHTSWGPLTNQHTGLPRVRRTTSLIRKLSSEKKTRQRKPRRGYSSCGLLSWLSTLRLPPRRPGVYCWDSKLLNAAKSSRADSWQLPAATPPFLLFCPTARCIARSVKLRGEALQCCQLRQLLEESHY